MIKLLKKYFKKDEEVEVPQYTFNRYDKTPFDVRIGDRPAGVIYYNVRLKEWAYNNERDRDYTSKDLMKIAFKVNSLNN